MKTRKAYLGAAFLSLAVAAPAMAHDTSAYSVRPAGTWSGSAIVVGGSQGISGWTGTISYNGGYAYAPAPVPVVTVLPPAHRHGPACHRNHPRAYARHKAQKYDHRYDRRHDYRH